MVRFGMVGAALALMAAPLLAQETTEQLKKELQELRAEVDAMKVVNVTREIPAQGKVGVDAMAADESPVMTLFKGTKLSGFVDAGYQITLSNLHSSGGTFAESGNNNARLFDNSENSFYLNSVLLQLERLATKDMIVGYHIELEAGHNIQTYEAGGNAVGLQEGWLQILAPIGSGLDIRVGKMACLCGYEVVESVSDMNYSRGLLFSLIQPITNTGVRVAYSFVEQVTATIGFANSINNSIVNNPFFDTEHGKMFESQIAIKPIKDLLISASILVGNDTNFSGGDSAAKFYVFDLVVAYTMDKLTVALNYDKASAQNVGGGGTRAPYSGIAVYGKYQVNDWFASALRVEYLSDENGFQVFPVIGGGVDTGTGARIFEFTLTQEFKVAQQMIVRIELRHDNSNQHTFFRDDKRARGDTTLGFEAILPF